MAVIDTTDLFRNTRGQTTSIAAAEERAKSKLWLNPGKLVNVTNPTTGEVEERFVAVPGVAIDTAKPREVPPLRANGSNKLYRDQVIAGNKLHALLVEEGMKLKPGETRIVNLQIQLQRINEETGDTTTVADDNPFNSIFNL